MTDTLVASEVLTNLPDGTNLAYKFSQSELYTINRCKRQWGYQYKEGLAPNTTPDYLTKGSFFHTLMADYLLALQRGEVLDIAAHSIKLQGDAIRAGDPTVSEPDRTSLVAQLTAFWNDLGTDGFDVLAVEQEFYADLGWRTFNDLPAPLHGFVDAVVRTTDGSLWIVEHKTAGRAWSTQQFQFAYQGKLYCDAWEVLTGERPAGIQYNFFYPKRYEVRQMYVTEGETAILRDEIQSSIRLRDYLLSQEQLPREPHWGCNDCRFRDLCFTELSDGDGQYIRDTQFTVDGGRKDRFDVD